MALRKTPEELCTEEEAFALHAARRPVRLSVGLSLCGALWSVSCRDQA